MVFCFTPYAFGGLKDDLTNWFSASEETEAKPVAQEVDLIKDMDVPVTIKVVEEESAASKAMFAFLAVGTFWFWTIILVELGVLFYFIDRTNGSANLAFLGFLATLQWVFGVDLIGYVLYDPIRAGVIVCSYIVIGIFWAMFRWRWFAGSFANELLENKQTILDGSYHTVYGKNYKLDSSKRVDEKNRYLKETWNEFIDRVTFKAKEYKGLLIQWMACWPISMIWFLISDFVRELFSKIYYRMSKFFDKISQGTMKSIKDKE